ncbi:MAG TPA: hypothetical protein VGF48_20040 [Thermoanaerobaculia bacterium]|jgi:cold shock CspA family protein
MRYGHIDRFAERPGIGLIQPDDGGEAYSFDFFHIEGWKGETARALGLRAGRPVEFTAENGTVRTVRLLPFAA